jgi:hypothetical protein
MEASVSIEQTNDFHLVRRLARIIAPDFRLFATARVPDYACVLDLKKKTIEVGESDDIFRVIPALLFQLGHLKQKDDPRYALFNGNGVSEWPGSMDALVEKMSRQGVKADFEAAKWASSVFRSYWPDREDIEADLFDRYVSKLSEWRQYFNER